MFIDLDDELLRDFLAEADGILETLVARVAGLDAVKDASATLDAVFRDFHTLKGGAGFIGLDSVACVCHQAENILLLVRDGHRAVDSQFFDSVLEWVDTLQQVFARIRAGEAPSPIAFGFDQVPTVTHAEPSLSSYEAQSIACFEDLLSSISEPRPAHRENASAPDNRHLEDSTGVMTDAEFEHLLDELHGIGQPPGRKIHAEKSVESAARGDADDVSEFQNSLFGPDVELTRPAEKRVRVETAGDTDSSSEFIPLDPTLSVRKDSHRVSERLPGSVFVDAGLLDQIANATNELTRIRRELVSLNLASAGPGVRPILQGLDEVAKVLSRAALHSRQQSFHRTASRLPKLVRRLAQQLEKEAVLHLSGAQVELERELTEAIFSPLVHLLRNAIDHGIESAHLRESLGKPAQGTVSLSVERDAHHVIFRVEDDGAGLDAEEIRKAAVEQGLMAATRADQLTLSECFELIFVPGFSTRRKASFVSGRGVGLDAVKADVQGLGGRVEVKSVSCMGTCFTLTVPVPTPSYCGLLVELGKQVYVLPVEQIVEVVELDRRRVDTTGGKQCVWIRGSSIPLVYPYQLVGRALACDSDVSGAVVVTRHQGECVALVFDRLLGREEVVFESLDVFLAGTPGLCGTTIVGDGRAALVVDVPDLFEQCLQAA